MKVKMLQQENNDESALKEGCTNEENRTGGHGFTSGVSPTKINMLGEQITARQLKNHERLTKLV